MSELDSRSTCRALLKTVQRPLYSSFVVTSSHSNPRLLRNSYEVSKFPGSWEKMMRPPHSVKQPEGAGGRVREGCRGQARNSTGQTFQIPRYWPKRYWTNVSNSAARPETVPDKRPKFHGSAESGTGQTSEIPWLCRNYMTSDHSSASTRSEARWRLRIYCTIEC